MLIVKSRQLKSSEKATLRRFCRYVMDRFVTPAQQAKATVVIKFVDPRSLDEEDREDMREYQAWMIYNGLRNGKKHFTLLVSTYVLRNKAKCVYRRLRNAMECIGHELVHVKQYITNESFDYANGDVRFKGKRYKDWEKGEAYFFSPWELEAYGYEYGLYKCFVMKERKKQSA